jgi:hypothetical protein
MGTCFSISETLVLVGSKTWVAMMERGLMAAEDVNDLYSWTAGLETVFEPVQQLVVQARSSIN